MINLIVDEAYAFDYLSVLEIKKNNSLKDHQYYSMIFDHVRLEVGNETFDRIIASKIYHEMIDANKKIYDLIDDIRIKKINMDAKIVDDANNQRFFLKRKLQQTYFANELTELKTGI